MKAIGDIQKNSVFEETLAPVSRMDLIKYAGASGDFNPIHTIDEEASMLGFLVSSLMVCGQWGTLLNFLPLIMKKASFKITKSDLLEWFFFRTLLL